MRPDSNVDMALGTFDVLHNLVAQRMALVYDRYPCTMGIIIASSTDEYLDVDKAF